jgi:predicted N-acetyltransferase YhbS
MNAATSAQLVDDADLVIVREARLHEHTAVGAVLLRSYEQYEPHLPPEALVQYLTDLMDISGRATRGKVLVAEREKRIVGTGTFYANASLMGMGFPARWAGMTALAVDPDFQRVGVGRQLMLDGIARATRTGAEALALHTGEFMTATQALYTKLGFRRIPAHDVNPPIRARQDRAPLRALAYGYALTRPIPAP